MNGPTQLLIGGKFQDAQSGRTFPTINPATEKVIAHVAEADAADIDAAVKAARTAFSRHWRRMEARERAKLLWRIGDLIMQNADELGAETMDNGKPIFESRYIDIPSAAETFTTTQAGAPRSRRNDRFGDFFNYTLREQRRVRNHHSLELPAAHGRMETCAGAGMR